MAVVTLEEFLAEYLRTHTNAKKPIDPETFSDVPFFEEVFPKTLWQYLVKLGGNDGVAHIEKKIIPQGSKIIQKGDFDMMVFWLLAGKADVKVTIGKRETVVKHYNQTGHCFGEMAIIGAEERKADVYACSKEGATILEVDWSITSICFELEGRLNNLLLKTVNKKLEESYDLNKKAYMALVNVKRGANTQSKEIEALKEKLEKSGVKEGGSAS